MMGSGFVGVMRARAPSSARGYNIVRLYNVTRGIASQGTLLESIDTTVTSDAAGTRLWPLVLRAYRTKCHRMG
jgi:hypothetical protein